MPSARQAAGDRRADGDLPARGRHFGVHAGADARDLGHADVVDLLGRQVGGRIETQGRGVGFGAVRQARDPGVGRGQPRRGQLRLAVTDAENVVPTSYRLK